MKLRLLDAVIIAAVALLGLKAIDLFTSGDETQVRKAAPVVPKGEVAPGSFGRMLTRPRASLGGADPLVTGSIGNDKKAPEAAGGEKKPDDGKGADTRTAQAPQAPIGPQALPQLVKSKPVSFEPGPTDGSDAQRALLERLGARREEIDSRARELDTREKLLETAERKVETRLAELKAIEDRMTEGDRRARETEAAALKNLVTMYETMKPKDAARIFDRLSLDILVPVVLQMNPRKMSEVLAAMAPEAAEKLTVSLATRARMNEQKAGSGPPALPANELPAIDQGAAPAR